MCRLSLLICLALACCGCRRAPPEHLDIVQELALMTGDQQVDAFSISRDPRGDYFVSGSVHSLEGEAWTARMGPNGNLRWDFRYRPFGNEPIPNDVVKRKERASRFYDAVTLADDKTGVCGIRSIEHKPAAFLVILDASGKLVEDRVLISPDGIAVGIRCFKWGKGVAIVSVISRIPRGTGRLIMLDDAGSFLWEKYSQAYVAGDMSTSGGNLLTIASDDGMTKKIFKIRGDGSLLGSHAIPDGDAHFMHPTTSSPTIRVGVLQINGQSAFLAFDNDLRRQIQTVTVSNAGIKKGLELADHSLIIFGNTIGNDATASIARVYVNATSRRFILEPRHASSWINDAALGNKPHEFVTVRQQNGGSIMSWMAVKPD
jgi:hypothetical protein